ncbi:VOC family protein [Natrarchaeobaculum aegyptiacum]|uniref:Glyoxalase n=1 Tax=Natrarchaeobaculum aegyptiacum TaxID=745377 RepID=A0A2Z2HQV6_9EURY|nr:VOC family protein [Natrarchaeobaculum aegyptiacum]ARS89540.1 glyoxalase [Natrarchaeobaculum aegyptiacum]
MDSHDVPIRVDHVGIAVESVADAEPVLAALGCEKIVDDVVEDRFRWVYYELGNASRIELIEPVAEESFLTTYLEEHGPGLHHVTLEVGDIEAVMEVLEAKGITVVDYAEYEGWNEAFVSPRNATGTLFQLMEYADEYPESQGLSGEELYVGGSRVDSD